LRWLKRLVGERGFEPPTPWSRSNDRNIILLIRLAWFCVLDHGFTRFSAVIGPKLDPSFRGLVIPLQETVLSRCCHELIAKMVGGERILNLRPPAPKANKSTLCD